MSEFKNILKKQGGAKFITNCIRSHTLFTTIFLILTLGFSKKSLEITRHGIQLKKMKRLNKKYIPLIEKFNKENKELSHETSNYVWLCWFQGIDNAPEIVKKCYNSIKKHLSDKKIIVITEKNLSEYVKFPDYIIEKWRSGIITNTHMTDLLRLELLIKYGGTWIDATVLCTEKSANIPRYYFESDLFLYQCLKPGKDGHSLFVSSWFMSAKTNNKVLLTTRYLCYEYWKKYNYMIDYFLLHYFLCITLNYYQDEYKKIVPVSNSTPHILLLRLFEEYNDEIWKSIVEQTPFHKLSYKFAESELLKENTYYKKIINNDIAE